MSYIEKIFKNPLPSVAELEARYPKRNLGEGAKVTRFAPSPTGFLHVGALYSALIDKFLAAQSNGVYILRVEDTDTKREVEGATELMCKSLADFGIVADEGFDGNGNEIGNYGPYKQSMRKDIYHAYIKHFLEIGKAYVCFATPEELDLIRKEQEVKGVRPGYYGQYAKYRNYPTEEVERRINEGDSFVIRFKSPGNYEKKIICSDGLKGKVTFPENDLDIVIMKGDWLPTYHFAHVIDDTLMGTTDVIRGDEWLTSLPLHLQLFAELGFKAPNYTHTATIQKMDEGGKRKLSKRKDPEADVRYYDEAGYPRASVVEYLLNLINSSFEEWRKANWDKPYTDFVVDVKKLSPSGALFDFVKLDSVSKEVVCRMSVDEVFDGTYNWAKQNDEKLFKLIDENKEYVRNILSIERTGEKNSRKDIAKFADVFNEISYFFEDEFAITVDAMAEVKNTKHAKEMVDFYLGIFDINDDRQAWFEKMKQVATQFNYATNGKEYKANPEVFNGDVSSVVKVFRILITGRAQSPDLSAIMQVLGSQRVMERLGKLHIMEN